MAPVPGRTLSKVSCKSGHRFCDQFNSATAGAESPHGERLGAGKVRRRVRTRHTDLRWAAPIWSISASLLCVGSFTCPFVAQSGHHDRAEPCPLLGVKRTSRGHASMSGYPPMAGITRRAFCNSPGNGRALRRKPGVQRAQRICEVIRNEVEKRVCFATGN